MSGSSGGSSCAEVLSAKDEPEEATEEEVRDYAVYIGIDPEAEPDLLWIAREGVSAPVPHPWKTCREGSEVFYFNFETSESLWDHPCDAQYRTMVEEHRRKRAEKDDAKDAVPAGGGTVASSSSVALVGHGGSSESGAGRSEQRSQEAVAKASRKGADATRPQPLLDNSQWCSARSAHSSHSSCPSEVSEDFRSDWGAPTPAVRSPGSGADTGGHSLEMSASMSMSMSMDADAARTTPSGAPGSPGHRGKGPVASSKLDDEAGGTASWIELRRELEFIASVVAGCIDIRVKQREYLRQLKSGA